MRDGVFRVSCTPTMMQRIRQAQDRMSSIVRFALIALLLLLAMVPAAAATLKEAIEQVERETRGKVLSADTIRTRGTVVYRIKVLMPDGRVRIFQIPA
jgi:uncharacterized membrane protein YkoI